MSNYFSKALRTQTINIPPPPLTEQNLPDQSGRVHIITGGYAGVGLELAKILYAKGATLYIAGRNEEKGQKAIEDIKKQHPSSSGALKFLLLDLSDLSTIKSSAETFIRQESRLDVLVNNAGVMIPPKGSKTAQGHELQLGTNCLGPFLFTKLLMPVLIRTAGTAPPNSVRVIWASSSGIQVWAPDGGVVFEGTTGTPKVFDVPRTDYGQSKVGNVLLAVKLQELCRQHGIVSVSFNPGNLKTELQRHTGGLLRRLGDAMLYPAVFGAYTELYSGWNEDITAGGGVTYVMPWGRDGSEMVREDIRRGMKEGLQQKFWDWCERETEMYA
ncbi:short-chain dehydrogenase [Trematosphaeria pertusa]|uniref:Short-chain dehydrogenase n=1 Tax=Trematosphaeria pertusa TaxID=390896 RepID=A0A6A6IXE6_9PLEO|nr:short-chain dehydrogenase [Trematosphaeria pertusa]KAF2253863.1 short-chain dehydrogenase [Trematosphaeria pertusa]